MLTDKEARSAAKKDRPYRLADGKGLHLQVEVNGSKLWRYRYEFAGKEKMLALGKYPAVSLSQAREKRDEARRQLEEGRDPSTERKLRRVRGLASSADTFETLALAWLAQRGPIWAPRHVHNVRASFYNHVFPSLGGLPIREITSPMVLSVLREIEKQGSGATARAVRQRISAVFVFAIASGIAETDPAAVVVKAMAPVQRGRQPAKTDLPGVRAVLEAGEAQSAFAVTKLALRLLALTAVRPGELRGMRWTEVEGLDGPEPLWRIPAPRMKMREEHVVPLAAQAVEVLQAVRPLTGKSPLVFPSMRHAHKPLSANAIGYLLNRAGYGAQHVPHGFRAAFSTVMNECFPADRAIIDLMLAHKPKDKIEAAYNRAEHNARRRALAQLWADLLLDGAPPAAALLDGTQRLRPSPSRN